MRKWTWKEKKLHLQGVTLLLLSMVAVALLSEVSKQNWGLSLSAPFLHRQLDAEARDILAAMSVEERVAQLLLVQGADAEAVWEYGFGGVMLDAELLEGHTSQETAKEITALQNASKLPLLIAAEEEGGCVNTVSRYPTLRSVPFLSPQELMITGGMPMIRLDTGEKSRFLMSLGINVNFAPLCHVTTAPTGAMFFRAFGSDASHTAHYVSAVVEEMEAQGMISVLKGFPGYGDLTVAELPVDSRGAEVLEGVDFLPFAAGIEAGAPMVLMGHTVVTALDEMAPAALSQAMHRQLRRELGFEGVIVTDCLMHDPWELYAHEENPAVRAIEAGNDLLLTDDGAAALRTLMEAVEEGRISRKRLEESVLRILKLKIEYGIISP